MIQARKHRPSPSSRHQHEALLSRTRTCRKSPRKTAPYTDSNQKSSGKLREPKLPNLDTQLRHRARKTSPSSTNLQSTQRSSKNGSLRQSKPGKLPENCDFGWRGMARDTSYAIPSEERHRAPLTCTKLITSTRSRQKSAHTSAPCTDKKREKLWRTRRWDGGEKEDAME
jgi:hypothetical protein